MDLDEYQERAGKTDQNPKLNNSAEVSRVAQNCDVIPLLGLVGEVGALLGEYKKLLRDGTTYRKFGDEVGEELGDILWYVANVASKFNLSLNDIAEQNLGKVEDRWSLPTGTRRLYDERLPENQQLPRRFEYSFEHRSIDGVAKVVMVDRLSGDSIETTGDPLTDNAYENDGYRFHDVLHLAFAACLGWSPVLRKLLRNKNKLDHRSPPKVDEVEDGGRARVVEEGIAFAGYVYAADHDYLAGVGAVDWQLLRHIKKMTSRLEVRNRSTKEWNDALLRGFAVWRQLRECGGGTVRGDLTAPYFMKMAAQGQSFFQASGDSGAYTSSSKIYPADDPYVTAVGGTDLTTSSAGGPWSLETAWVDGGGGISPDDFAIPTWQQLSGVINSSNEGSTAYRNGPDVSANANFSFYVCADQTTCTANEYGGTSFAAPMWAGYLALVNQQAVANDSPPPGFINPTIYPLGLGSGYDTDFHDIISSVNNGYPAVAGYDLATGWGSPNGTGLINALAGTPSPNFTISASPTSVSVVQGSNGTSTITTAALGGFDSAITLSATGQPSGVTVAFNPTSITGSGSSTVTFTVASSTATGTYPIMITGTSGSITHTTTVSLTVPAPASADFTISALPTAITVARGKSGTSTITTAALNGFSSAITLSASGQGSGQTVTFSPNPIAAPGSGTSTMTVKVGTGFNFGSHTITITGAGGGKTHTTTVTLTIGT